MVNTSVFARDQGKTWIAVYCAIYLLGALCMYAVLISRGTVQLESSKMLLFLLIYNTLPMAGLCQQCYLLYARPELKGLGVSASFYCYLAGSLPIQLSYASLKHDYGLAYISALRILPYAAVVALLFCYRKGRRMYIFWFVVAGTSLFIPRNFLGLDFYGLDLLELAFLVSQLGISFSVMGQTRSLVEAKCKGSVSGFSLASFFVTGVVWTLYGVERQDYLILGGSVVASTVSAVNLCLWWRYPHLSEARET